MSADSPYRPWLRRARISVAGLLCGSVVAIVCAACGASATLTADVSTLTGATSTVVDPTTSTSAAATVTGPTTTTPRSAKATVVAGAAADVAPTSTQQGFLGLATELSTITTLSGTPADQDTPYVNLLKNLSEGAPFLLRLGGDSADWAWWQVPGMKQPLGIRYTLTTSWAADVKALLTSLGAKALLGVNLELDSKKVAAYEAQQYEKYIGPKLIDALEVGNEPELYGAFNYYKLANGTGVTGRVKGDYSIADYGRDFTNIASGLGSDPIAGPSSGSPTWLPDLSTMLSDLPSRLKLVTVHAYPMKRCSASTHLNVNEFFTSASIQGLAGSVQAMVKAAKAHGKALRVDEINGISCGGEAGVSNTLAEALWALNMLPALWKAGVQGVNWQDIDGNLNQIITATDSGSGWNVSVQPEYYGLLAFAQVAPAGSRLLTVSAPSGSGFYEYADKTPAGAENAVLTNVSSHARTVGVRLPGAQGSGLVRLLTGGSLTATSGTTLGGQKISASTGELSGAASGTLVKANAKGVYAVRVPAHSAAILTVGS